MPLSQVIIISTKLQNSQVCLDLAEIGACHIHSLQASLTANHLAYQSATVPASQVIILPTKLRTHRVYLELAKSAAIKLSYLPATSSPASNSASQSSYQSATMPTSQVIVLLTKLQANKVDMS